MGEHARDGRTVPEPAPRTSVRLVVVAPRPFQLDDLGIGDRIDIERASLVRRADQLAEAFAEVAPDLVIVDAAHLHDAGAAAIDRARALDPDVGVLVLTTDPPRVEDVARAVRAGASGFVDLDSAPGVVADAVRTVLDGGLWLPDEEVRGLLDQLGRDLEVSSAERGSRLTRILLGIIPLTGLIAALMAYLWRKYTGHIGVRPVDIAVDPASRIVDAIVGVSLLLGAFGPLLLVGNWLDMLRSSTLDRGVIGWFLRHRALAWLTASAAWLVIAWFGSRGPDPVLVLLVGPAVAVAIIARASALDEELPRFLRIQTPPKGVLVAGVTALVLFVAALGGEALLVGPELGPRGERGILVPRVIGFNAQPVEAFDVETGGPPRQLLYLGSNGEVYVLVDPCDDNSVEYVPVRRHRLEVIDEVACDAGDDP